MVPASSLEICLELARSSGTGRTIVTTMPKYAVNGNYEEEDSVECGTSTDETFSTSGLKKCTSDTKSGYCFCVVEHKVEEGDVSGAVSDNSEETPTPEDAKSEEDAKPEDAVDKEEDVKSEDAVDEPEKVAEELKEKEYQGCND